MSETKAEVHRIDYATPLAELVISTQELWNEQFGSRGIDYITTRDDPVVKTFPHAFAPLLERLRVAEDLNAVANGLRHTPL
jgi:hypothetical protein